MSLSGWAKAIKGNGGNASSLRGVRNSSVGNSKQKPAAKTNTGSGSRSKKKASVDKLGGETYRAYPTASAKAQEAKWRAESDMSTLAAAHDILKSPPRVKAAQRAAKEREIAARKAAEAVTGIKATKGE